ncbi:MAG: hypothetical protein NXI32_31330, partial [bacterium]|nr:hypothetical protein [bacterium]
MLKHKRVDSRFYAVLCLAIGCLFSPPLVADELEDTALSIAPSDVAFFSTSVNLQQSWRDFVESRFLARLRAVPYIQELEAEFDRQWEDPEGQLAEAKAWIKSPNIQNLLKLGQEMLSDETFVFGSDQWCDTIEGIVDLQNRVVDRMSAGPEAAQEFLMELTQEDIGRIRVPDTVFGFRINDVDNAQLQLDALEAIVRLGGSQVEEARVFLDRLKRSELKDGQTLSLTLDPSMIPLDTIPAPASEMAQRIVDLLEGRQFSFALGVKSKML